MKRFLWKGLFAMLVCVLFVSCGNTKATTTNTEAVYSLLTYKEFEIENEYVSPLRGNQISLIGNPNHLRVKQDSVMVYLPYFGVRRTGGAYNGDAGIKYTGLLKNWQLQEGKKGAYQVTFTANAAAENLSFTITVYPNKKTYTQVFSSARDNISYQGTIGAITK